MSLTDEMLLRYVDGTLSSAEAHVVEEQLEGDDLAAERMRFLRIGAAALASARDHDLADAPVERALALVAGRRGIRVAPARQGPSWGEWARPWRTAAGIALFAGGLALGMTFAPKPETPTVQVTAGGWIDKVVEYQSLYTRATVEPLNVYPDRLPEMEARLAAALGAPLQIPDLADAALEFRQGQQLEYNGKTIIQLVYLPLKYGKPVALCAIKKPIADMELRYLNQDGMGIVQWAKGGVEFLLVGERPRAELEAAARTAKARL
jgi:anti-sigma factor RsiW